MNLYYPTKFHFNIMNESCFRVMECGHLHPPPPHLGPGTPKSPGRIELIEKNISTARN